MKPHTFPWIIVISVFVLLFACVSPTKETDAIKSESLHDLKLYLLGLLNNDRASAGLSALQLGTNSAAQVHAEEMIKHSYVSHWGLDGLKPYMRFTRAGGVNYSAENAAGITSPPVPGANYREINVTVELWKIEKGFMDSAGHRANILDPLHKKVNLGIACELTCAVVQQFEGDYIEFEQPPQLTAGLFSVAGRLSDDFELSGIQIWYDRPPHRLTLGQLDRTRCYNTGEKPVVFLRKPLPSGQSYLSDLEPYSWDNCSNPYEVSSDVQRLDSPPPASTNRESTIPPSVIADLWEIDDGTFHVRADLTLIISDNGSGIYTVLIWGENGGDPVPLTYYSLVVGAN